MDGFASLKSISSLKLVPVCAQMSDFGILDIDFQLPECMLTTEDLEKRFGGEGLKTALSAAGVRSRRIAPPSVCASDLAFGAANRILDTNNGSRESVDLLIFCTQSPDCLVPATACMLHERLKLPRQCAAFDLNLGCSQYVYGLAVANSMLKSGFAKLALVLTGDTLTRKVHPRDRSIVSLMGDAGSATLVGEVGKDEGLVAFELGTDGTGHRYLMIPAGGSRLADSPETAIEEMDVDGNIRCERNLRMNGIAMFQFSVSTIPRVIESLLHKMMLSLEDVDLFLFHQAGKYVVECLMGKLHIPVEKTHFFIEEVGNTSGSSIPLLLVDAYKSGKVRPGMLIVIAGFGAGLSWGATLIRWPSEVRARLSKRDLTPVEKPFASDCM